jgi:hypothetical protein
MPRAKDTSVAGFLDGVRSITLPKPTVSVHVSTAPRVLTTSQTFTHVRSFSEGLTRVSSAMRWVASSYGRLDHDSVFNGLRTPVGA